MPLNTRQAVPWSCTVIAFGKWAGPGHSSRTGAIGLQGARGSGGVVLVREKTEIHSISLHNYMQVLSFWNGHKTHFSPTDPPIHQ